MTVAGMLRGSGELRYIITEFPSETDPFSCKTVLCAIDGYWVGY